MIFDEEQFLREVKAQCEFFNGMALYEKLKKVKENEEKIISILGDK